MKYAVEMSSSVMTYIPSFVESGSRIQTLIWGDTQAHREHDGLISILSFLIGKVRQ
jgi:hypothetical protein